MKFKSLPRYRKLDQWVSAFLRLISSRYRVRTIVISFALYISILLFFGDVLKISCNYFVILPLLAFAFVYGFPGGLAAGILALPLNMLVFRFMGRMDYLPASLVIAEVSGITVGGATGYLSQFFYRLIVENENRKETEGKLRDLLKEKDLLFREMNHRVRNNLNIIKSLIQLQSNKMDDPRFTEECEKLKDRVFSIALVHEQLYSAGERQNSELCSYLDSLLDNFGITAGEQEVEITRDWSDGRLYLSRDKLLYLGLIVHELLTNSLKYGAAEGKTLKLDISLIAVDESRHLLIVSDNGPGFDPDKVDGGLGLRLIETLSRQLEAEVGWGASVGSCFRIIF